VSRQNEFHKGKITLSWSLQPFLHTKRIAGLAHECIICNAVLTLTDLPLWPTTDLDVVKCTSDVNRDMIFFWVGLGGDCGSVLLNE
jgi:hypothetical protein